jgi:hypothetical protein
MKKIMSNFLLLVALAYSSAVFSLDKNGNFESRQEQDEFLIVTLRNMAREMNAQTPISLDEYTKLTSVIALQKTITFNYLLHRTNYNEINPQELNKVALENLNHSACQSKATQNLIDLGVEYVYIYFSNDGRQITRASIRSYRC